MSFYLQAFPYRLFLSIVVVILVFFSPKMVDGNFDDIPVHYKFIVLTTFFFHQVEKFFVKF
jgi:hypothetical protein